MTHALIRLDENKHFVISGINLRYEQNSVWHRDSTMGGRACQERTWSNSYSSLKHQNSYKVHHE